MALKPFLHNDYLNTYSYSSGKGSCSWLFLCLSLPLSTYSHKPLTFISRRIFGTYGCNIFRFKAKELDFNPIPTKIGCG